MNTKPEILVESEKHEITSCAVFKTRRKGAKAIWTRNYKFVHKEIKYRESSYGSGHGNSQKVHHFHNRQQTKE